MLIFFRPAPAVTEACNTQRYHRVRGCVALILAIISVSFFAPAISIEQWGTKCNGYDYGLWNRVFQSGVFSRIAACSFVLLYAAGTYYSLGSNCAGLPNCTEFNVIRVFAVLVLAATVVTVGIMVAGLSRCLSPSAAQRAQRSVGLFAGVCAVIAWATFCHWWQNLRGLPIL